MDSEPENTKDISLKRIFSVIFALGLGFFLLTWISLKLPEYFNVVGRLALTLALAAVIVKIHAKRDASPRQGADEPEASARRHRFSTIKRILLVWLALIFLTIVFAAI